MAVQFIKINVLEYSFTKLLIQIPAQNTLATITNKYKITIKKILLNLFRSCQKHCWLYSAGFIWIICPSSLLFRWMRGNKKILPFNFRWQAATERDTEPWRQGRVFVLDAVFQSTFLLVGRRPLVRRRWHLKSSVCWLLIHVKTDRRYRKFRLAPRRWWERDLFKTTRRKYLLLFFFNTVH